MDREGVASGRISLFAGGYSRLLGIFPPLLNEMILELCVAQILGLLVCECTYSPCSDNQGSKTLISLKQVVVLWMGREWGRAQIGVVLRSDKQPQSGLNFPLVTSINNNQKAHACKAMVLCDPHNIYNIKLCSMGHRLPHFSEGTYLPLIQTPKVPGALGHSGSLVSIWATFEYQALAVL